MNYVYRVGCLGQMTKVSADHECAGNYHATEELAHEAHTEKLAHARAQFEKNKPEAERKLDAIENAIDELKARYDCDIGFSYEGDTHGIYDEHQYITVKVNGFEYTRRIEL